jgi:hypothetical protein
MLKKEITYTNFVPLSKIYMLCNIKKKHKSLFFTRNMAACPRQYHSTIMKYN